VRLTVEFHPLAADEAVEAQAWYSQEQAGLGDRFGEAVDAAVDRASRSPNIGTPVVATGAGEVVIRRRQVSGFPWAIGYEVVDGSVLLVLAVFHERRTPNYWIDRAPDR